ncbi:hypothetical protein CN481_14180 [Bacillus sp. AFS006103]|nr:hypothetical protein CN481_14180 [Bacillus sp. AFS006103]
MFNHYVELSRSEVNKHIPRKNGVYIILLRLFQDMDFVPLYVGSTGENKTLAIRLKHYILIAEDPSRGGKNRPIDRLIANVKPNYLEVTYFCTDDYKEIESFLINRNSVSHISFLVNANGIGRYRDTAHAIVNDLIGKIAVITKKNKTSINIAENLIGVNLIFNQGETRKYGTIVDISIKNNSFIIFWRGSHIEEITLQKLLFSSQYQIICPNKK